jgi:hypothetical protein
VFVVCQGLQGNEPVGIEKSLDQRIVTVVVEIGSRLVYFVSVVGEIGSRLVCPCYCVGGGDVSGQFLFEVGRTARSQTAA